QLKIGEVIYVRASERIPADGKIVNGTTSVDESSITGESIPVTKEYESEVFAGTVALNGSITVETTKHANETIFQKIIEMIQSAKDEKSPMQLFRSEEHTSELQSRVELVCRLLLEEKSHQDGKDVIPN